MSSREVQDLAGPGMFTDEGGIEDLTAVEMTLVACNGTTPSVRRLVQRPRGHLRGEHGGKWLTVMEFFVNSQLFFAILPHALSSLHQCGSRSGSAAPGLRHSYVQYWI